MNKSRPVLRYHGGKRRLAPWIINHLPEHRVYVEPYCGAASVFMRKSRAYAEILNDLDGEILNVFRILRNRDTAQVLREQLMLTPFSRMEFERAYEVCEDGIERARRTFVKSFMGFGSAAVTQASPTLPGAGFKPTTGFRSNSNRSGSTPAHDWSNLPKYVDTWHSRLAGVVIESKKAVDLIAAFDSPRTLFYVDPPYVHSTRAAKRWRKPKSYRFEMTDEDHVELSLRLRSVQGMVVLSGYPSELYDNLYQGWHRILKDAYADGARNRVECLWLNQSASKAQPSLMEVQA